MGILIKKQVSKRRLIVVIFILVNKNKVQRQVFFVFSFFIGFFTTGNILRMEGKEENCDGENYLKFIDFEFGGYSYRYQ